MWNKILHYSFIPLSILSLLLISGSLLFAEESITITTYYPSPYGTYNQLQTNRLAVGDTNNNGQLDAGDQPNRDGDIRLKAQPGDPAGWTAGQIGQFAYSGVDDALYRYNGVWVKQAGGGGCYVSYSGSCLTGFTNAGSAGTYGNCHASSGELEVHFRPPGGSCAAGWASATYGEAVVCCQ